MNKKMQDERGSSLLKKTKKSSDTKLVNADIQSVKNYKFPAQANRFLSRMPVKNMKFATEKK